MLAYQQHMINMLAPWRAWNRASLRWWNQLFELSTGQLPSSSIYSLWQEWGRLNMHAWNQLLVSWGMEGSLAMLMNRTMEHYLAGGGLPGNMFLPKNEQFTHMMKIATTNDIARIAEMMIHLETKVDQLTDQIDHISNEAARSGNNPEKRGTPKE